MNIDKMKQIKILLFRCKSLKENMVRTLNDSSTDVTGRYASFKEYAREYNYLVDETSRCLDLSKTRIMTFNINNIKGWADTIWPQQKEIIESTIVYTDTLISILEGEIDFVEDEYTNLENLIKIRLRNLIYEKPEKELAIQNAVESLFIGKGWNKGVDYDRETGKFEFSGKEYIPDFIIPRLNLCLEVKLVKDGRKSRVVEEINADINAYNKLYKRQMYIVYDLGCIRDEMEFKRDFEESKTEIRIVIIKH